MSSRYKTFAKLSRKRLRDFVALDNLTAQVPLIEVIHTQRKRRIRIWTAYDPERVLGTYTEVHYDGMVTTATVYPSGNVKSIINRPADRQKRKATNVGAC